MIVQCCRACRGSCKATSRRGPSSTAVQLQLSSAQELLCLAYHGGHSADPMSREAMLWDRRAAHVSEDMDTAAATSLQSQSTLHAGLQARKSSNPSSLPLSPPVGPNRPHHVAFCVRCHHKSFRPIVEHVCDFRQRRVPRPGAHIHIIDRREAYKNAEQRELFVFPVRDWL